MSTQRKLIVVATIAAVGSYALTPFFAGLFNTYDRRGPKIFAEAHHEFLYKLGYYTAGHHNQDGKPRVPYNQARSWFYRFRGERLPEPRR